VRGKGAEFIAGYLDGGLHFNSPRKRMGGGIVNEPGAGNVPETWVPE
jgi:hypothetical protein